MLLHVGYHKTGSTWIQQLLFANPQTRFVLPFDRLEINQRLVEPNDLVFDPEPERARYAPAIAQARAEARVPVVSSERLVGSPHTGGWDAQNLALRLHAVFPDSRVLIILREQQSVIRSMYLQYVREGGPLSLAQYLHPPGAGAFRIPSFDFEYYAYHRLIEHYQATFGTGALLVLPFELLRADPNEFARRVCEFSGAATPSSVSPDSRNVALSALSAQIKRRLNHFFVRDRLNPGAAFPFKRANRWILRAARAFDRRLPDSWARPFDRRIRDCVAAEVGDRYRESNRRSGDRIGLDLGAFGYPT
ncbi:MAG: sulfotransferase [Myxococcota bacterium]